MENASKALIMAASILIGLMIISFAVFLIKMFADHSETLQKKIEDKVVAEFNQNFEKYQGVNDITIHDIIGLANLAKTNNEKYQLTDPGNGTYYIRVQLGITSLTYNLEKEGNEKLTELIKENTITIDNTTGTEQKKIKKFTCKSISYDENTKRVNQIVFSD